MAAADHRVGAGRSDPDAAEAAGCPDNAVRLINDTGREVAPSRPAFVSCSQEGAIDMRKVIDGKVYDTSTSEEICDISGNISDRSNFHYDDTRLYRTGKGAFFIAGHGGP